MAKISEENHYVDTPEKREAAAIRFVIQSSAIEGIYVTEQDLADESILIPKASKTSSPAKKDRLDSV